MDVVGLIVKTRPLVFIDTNVADGLLRDEIVAAALAEYRRNGCKIVLSPSVVYELVKVGPTLRRARIAAVMKHCDGITQEQARYIAESEVRELLTGAQIKYEPLLPTQALAEVRSAAGIIETLGDVWSGPKIDFVTVLEGLRIELRRDQVPIFEHYLRRVTGLLGEHILASGHRAGWVPTKGVVRAIPSGNWKRAHMQGLCLHIAILAANVWRRAQGIGKGAGSLSDIRQIVEASRGSVFLTRDAELFECFKVVKTGLTDVTLEVRFVSRAENT